MRKSRPFRRNPDFAETAYPPLGKVKVNYAQVLYAMRRLGMPPEAVTAVPQPAGPGVGRHRWYIPGDVVARGTPAMRAQAAKFGVAVPGRGKARGKK